MREIISAITIINECAVINFFQFFIFIFATELTIRVEVGVLSLQLLFFIVPSQLFELHDVPDLGCHLLMVFCFCLLLLAVVEI